MVICTILNPIIHGKPLFFLTKLGGRTTAACVHDVFSPKHAGRWSDSFKCSEMHREVTLKAQGGTAINKEAWSYNADHPPFVQVALPCLHTPTKKRTPADVGRMFTEQASRGGEEKWQSHWRLRTWWKTGDFSCHGRIVQRDVHSQGAWRRQEIDTENFGPKEGCTDPAQAPPVHARWVKRHRACASPRLS